MLQLDFISIISSDFTSIIKIHRVNKANLMHNFFSMFISLLYMFRATMCPSSGEIIVSMRHFVFVTLKQMDSSKLQEHIVARNMQRKEINILRRTAHQVGFINPLNPELNPICYLLALLGAHHFLHVSRIRVKLLTFRRLMSYIYGAPILDVSRPHTTTQHSR